AVGDGSHPRHARRHGGRGDGGEQVLRHDGRGARRRGGAGAARERRGEEEAGPEGPPLAQRRAPRGYLLRRLTGGVSSARWETPPSRRTRSATPASTRACCAA